MGEFHPAEKKVVVQFCPADLGLTEQQQSKLAKLAGPRYNPETGIIRMSCEMFEHQAQNKRYLGDLVESLIAEAKVRSILVSPLAMYEQDADYPALEPQGHVRGRPARHTASRVQGQA